MSNDNNLEALMDQIVASALLKKGKVPPARIAERYPEVEVSEEEYRFIRVKLDPTRWSREQDEVIIRKYGLVPEEELVKAVNEVLRRELGGVSDYERSWASVDARARKLGFSISKAAAVNGELTLLDASRFLELPYEHLFNAYKRGELPTRKHDKYRFVKVTDVSNWYVKFRETLLIQDELLNLIGDTPVVSKKEAMEITGLCETHLTRYLQSQVITAWKLPSLTGPGRRGEWLVSRESAEAVREARRQGKLGELLAQHPAYLKMQAKNNAIVMDLRRRKPVGIPDPLTTPQSRYHPGCFTLQQMATHLRLSVRVLYEHIERGELKVEVVHAPRPRYGIQPDEAHRFVKWFRERGLVDKSGGRIRYQEIAEAGLLSYPDLAARWGVSMSKAHDRVREYRIPHQTWGRLAVFEPDVIAAFEPDQSLQTIRVPDLLDTPWHREAAGRGLLTIEDLALRWQTSLDSARGIVRRHKISPSGRLTGNRAAYDPERIDQFDQERARYLTHHHREAAEAGLWLVEDAADHLGISRSLFRTLVKAYEIPHTRRGPVMTFNPADVQAFRQKWHKRTSYYHWEAIKAGMWLLDDLAARWKTGRDNVRRIVAKNKIPCTRFGRLLAFKPADIEAFEQNRTGAAEQRRREAAAAGCWLTGDVAARWKTSQARVREIAQKHNIPSIRLPPGRRILAFRQEVIEAFERKMNWPTAGHQTAGP